MTSDDGVLAAARAIRPYLNRLADDPGTADRLDRAIGQELADTADRPAAVRRLRVLLEEDGETAWFLTEVLRDDPAFRPPYQQPDYWRGFRGASPAGAEWPVEAECYACPEGDYVWYRPDIGTPVMNCPTHHTELAPA